MTVPKISIIVPVFNVEQYLPRCIDSILNQSFRNFELLLIDDGSSDNSGNICDRYAKNDFRIKVFHKKNGEALFGVLQLKWWSFFRKYPRKHASHA